MPTYIAQIIGSTNLDRQGECIPRSVLEGFCTHASGKRIPVHQNHDMARPVVGYMENVRIQDAGDDSKSSLLVADVVLYEGTYDESWQGFSLSAVVLIREADEPESLVYLPYPAYNDVKLVAQLSADPTLNIGKWIKKGADENAWAVFGATIAYLLKPAWDDVYKRVITPIVNRFLETHGARLLAGGLHLEHVQLLVFSEHTVEVRFKPSPGKERFCFSQQLLHKGLQLAASLLTNDPRAISPGVMRIVLSYDDVAREYSLLRTEYRDGTVESAV